MTPDEEIKTLLDAMYPWTHALPAQAIAGRTTQNFRRFGNDWLIVHEISARAPGD